ncbi:S-2-haloacid dehalogenase [Bisporella sp. PMI_857]|nr:S-2-haloacid dehalogenase [Bisporella sp. PMI_857]
MIFILFLKSFCTITCYFVIFLLGVGLSKQFFHNIMAFDLKAFKVLSFDIYGTLIDWETGIYDALLPILHKLPLEHPNHPSQNVPVQTRKFLLSAYTKLELTIQKENPTLSYPRVLAEIYSLLATSYSIPFSTEDATSFGSTIGQWPAFSDTVAAMQYLAKHYKLVVLSNVDKASFSQTLSGPLAGVKFDAIYTAEDIGSYKPNVKNFAYLVEHAKKDFGAKKEEILKVAQSLIHDHVPAKKSGLPPSVWIKRAGNEVAMGGKIADWEKEVNLAATYTTLRDFAEAVKAAFGDS